MCGFFQDVKSTTVLPESGFPLEWNDLQRFNINQKLDGNGRWNVQTIYRTLSWCSWWALLQIQNSISRSCLNMFCNGFDVILYRPIGKHKSCAPFFNLYASPEKFEHTVRKVMSCKFAETHYNFTSAFWAVTKGFQSFNTNLMEEF
jgi:hypothetical protein